MTTTSLILATADAIASDLNRRTYAPAFMAVRTWLSEYELEDLSTLRVDVVPRGPRTISQLNRASREQQFTVDVVVQQRVDVSDNTDCDALMALADSIVATFPTGYVVGSAKVMEVGQEELFDEERLVKTSVFRAVISIACQAFGGEPTPPAINEPELGQE